jgi:hypothetical protein
MDSQEPTRGEETDPAAGKINVRLAQLGSLVGIGLRGRGPRELVTPMDIQVSRCALTPQKRTIPRGTPLISSSRIRAAQGDKKLLQPVQLLQELRPLLIFLTISEESCGW